MDFDSLICCRALESSRDCRSSGDLYGHARQMPLSWRMLYTQDIEEYACRV